MSGYNGTNGWNGTTYDPNAVKQPAFHYGPNAPTTDPRPNYGGYSGGANAAANHYAGLAQGALTEAAPVVAQGPANQDAQQYQDAAAQQQLALAQLQRVAEGGATAADAQLQSGISQTQGAERALAEGARGGGANLAAARQGVTQNAAQIGQRGVQQAGILKAQEQQRAQAALMQGQLDVGGQQLGAQGAAFDQAQALAQLEAQQRATNQQGALGYGGLAQGAELGQLGADSSTYSANVAAQQADQNRKNEESGNLIGAGGKMLAASGALLFL